MAKRMQQNRIMASGGKANPWIVEIKRNSLDDGPGIRSVVFFKGCPLDCVWCQNPETISPAREVSRDAMVCLACGACTETCHAQVARPAAESEGKRSGCDWCGECIEACPSGARKVLGDSWAIEDLTQLLLRDREFYRSSGGGVTLSGGEPTLFPAYVAQLARNLAENRIDTLLETCGYFDWDFFSKNILPWIGTIYFDVKFIDPEQHKRYTGKNNSTIQDNLQRLARVEEVRVLPRVPLVPGVTDTPENLRAIAETLADLGLPEAMLLPYNPTWLNKARAVGRTLKYDHGAFMEEEEIARCRVPFENAGLEVR